MPDFPGPDVPQAAVPQPPVQVASQERVPVAGAVTPMPGPVVTGPIPDDDSDSMVFDDLVADLSKPLETTEELWALGQRKNYHVRYRKIADYSEIERATKSADRARRKPNARPGEMDVNALTASAILLATHNTGILRNGHEWRDGKGDLVTFRHPLLLSAFGVKTAREAVTTAYGWDADVIRHANQLQMESGWTPFGGDDEDPIGGE